ncbi:PREDICTED: serendipity locus protein alpha [Drosophila arizonae]|uniref:Serendipity locus protein alpha n=1 Tax=Drosophila arizonae TaxID=7263 RepID=A0ABM1PDG4_DROAR|nr:PREDICTED: serendipity locus protein alpha [Drosophila arizonae]
MQPLKLDACLRMLDCSRTTNKGDKNWLNEFCAKFLTFASDLQIYINKQLEHETVEIICLCLTQILICVRQLECTIQTEEASGLRIHASHLQFTDRITVCLNRLRICLLSTANGATQDNATEGVSFVKLLDSLLDLLTDFTSEHVDKSCIDVKLLSKQVKCQVDLLLGQTLSFANVALQQDKRALSALCQRVMRDCSAFQEDCLLATNYSNQKLRALTLEQALYQLEEYLNEALLRLVYTCFLDFQKLSVDKIRNLLRNSKTEAIADEFIADFDVNLDRATQIGIYAIAFAPNLKVKTIVRSCLASFEYLDTSLIPSLQSNASDLHSELLEQHFKEEMSRFKQALQEIINSRAFVACYLQILTNALNSIEKQFDKAQLEDLLQMGFSILEHFQLDANRKVVLQPGQEQLQNFVKILRECKAILMCAAQVEPERIIKRFKILRNILRKLHANIVDEQSKPTGFRDKMEQTVELGEEGATDSLQGLTASPSRSILYNTQKQRSRANSCKLEEANVEQMQSDYLKLKAQNCVRRKESLRTTMFKRQNVFVSAKLQTNNESQSGSLEISEILNQLTCLTSSFSMSLQAK